MIIGYGDIASILNDRPGALFFASGVSNSSEKDETAYHREIDLLLAQDQRYCCFYFSSITVGQVDSRYMWHKLKMEQLIRSNFNNYNILRLGNIDWGKNPHTFINAIRKQKDLGNQVEIRDEMKYIISQEDLLALTDNLPLVGQRTLSVFSRMGKVKDFI